MARFPEDIQDCPLCNRKIVESLPTNGRDTNIYVCEVCGTVDITDQAIAKLNNETKYLLSAISRNHFESTRKAMQISSGDIESLISQANIPRTIQEKLDKIINHIAKQSTYPGSGWRFDLGKDYPIGYCQSATEFRYLLGQLKKQGFIDFPNSSIGVLEPKGWERVEAFRNRVSRSDQAFVAMWFTPDLERVYTGGIEKAILDTGYRPMRVDKLEHNGKICDAIIAEIRRSRFLIADFTGHRGGVYFEAGFAMGLGIPVIWLCKEEEIEQAHFDTRQYNHIVWSNEKDLYQKLNNRIRATIVQANNEMRRSNISEENIVMITGRRE